jgi:hypothetical protein
MSEENSDERHEAERQLREAMKIINDTIRRAHKAGLDVDAYLLTMHLDGRPMPQVDFSTKTTT